MPRYIAIGAFLTSGLLSVSALAQEGEIVQREKARREQELREVNAPARPGQVAGARVQRSAPPASPSTAARKNKAKKRVPKARTGTVPR